VEFHPAPQLSGLKAGKLRSAKGGKLRVKLTETATVSIVLQRLRPGRRHGQRCSVAARRGRKCTLASSFAQFKVKLVAGTRVFKLPARISGHRLTRGSYRLTATARDSTGARSRPDVTTVVVR
jgi:hypothetical protein